jgi:hypothetical protein
VHKVVTVASVLPASSSGKLYTSPMIEVINGERVSTIIS